LKWHRCGHGCTGTHLRLRADRKPLGQPIAVIEKYAHHRSIRVSHEQIHRARKRRHSCNRSARQHLPLANEEPLEPAPSLKERRHYKPFGIGSKKVNMAWKW